MFGRRVGILTRVGSRTYAVWAGVSDPSIYHEVADAELATLASSVETLFEESDQGGDYDVDLAQGVLTIALSRGRGKYVLNKQTPTRQLWWSSPFSGPKRFDYDDASKRWINSRDQRPLRSLLEEEMISVCGSKTRLLFQ